MRPRPRWLGAIAPLLLGACSRPAPPVAQAASRTPAPLSQPARRDVRITGTIQAVRSTKIFVPQIYGQNGSLTLTHIIPNGSRAQEGDVIAAFDATQQLDNARDAQAKYEDLGHQVEQKRAQNRADHEKRVADFQAAEAALAKALIELQKGPLLSEIDRLKNEEKARIARIYVDSLKKSQPLHDKSDEAALRVLELQRDRQKVALERTQANIRKLQIKAPLAGMIAQEIIFRNGSANHAQEGDQMYRGQPLVSIFDPTEMSVRCTVGEPDRASLTQGIRANVYLDAYPDLVLPAHLEFASPVASSALGSPIKTFTAVFHLDRIDSHLLPDLSAAVVLEFPTSAASTGGGAK